MTRLTFNITNSHSVASGETYRLTLCGAGEEVTLELDETQISLVESRLNRAFYVRCHKQVVLQEIDNAGNYLALEKLARKYYLCDACSFADINLYGVKRILKVIVEALYKYPRLRSKLCFIGTHQTLEKLFIKLEEGDEDVLKSFNLQYIYTKQNAQKLGRVIHNILTSLIAQHEGYVATAMCAFGLFDALLLDENDYNGYAYLDFISLLRKNEASGFHPVGCHTPESIVYHELGHLLDDMCDLCNSGEFTSYYNGLSALDIKSGLSEYALESPMEFIAEAFAEYMCNPAPRPIAAKVGNLLDTAYAKRR